MRPPDAGLGAAAAVALVALLALCLAVIGYGATEGLTAFLLWLEDQ